MPEDYSEFLRKHGRSTPDVYELAPADADYFQAQMQALKDSSRYSASVNVHSLDEYRNMRLFVTDDGKAGGALRGDELMSLWAHKDGNYPHVSSALLGVRVSQGGRILNCFDTVLPDLYSFCGFTPTARLPWDDRFAPEGWDHDTYRKYNEGRPDVVFMTYDPEALGSRYIPGSGRVVDSYDAGVTAAREAFG
ncbi:hypothetical protein ACLMAJ_29825 [Nocardia sp. KC 131]|uniref:hypothetical protein n=1 Tax=Nocardia arseniciresistens TaxID=3392119 RepID=UPI00398F1B00